MGLIERHPTQYNSTSDRLQVAIAGFDVEGRATYRYLKSKPNLDITILDEREVEIPEGVAGRFGEGVFDSELEYEQVWRTPSLPPGKIKTGGQLMSGTKEFLARCPAPIIGVTGSKGKGTTASLINAILQNSSKTSHLVGNIGQPALDVLQDTKPDDIVVYELSSFQLWDLEQSPATAVVLMVEPDHLDVHKDLDDYIRAKQNIVRWQTPENIVVHHPTNELALKVAAVGLGEKQAFLTTDAAYIKDKDLMIEEQKICSVDDFGLLGEHNHENIAAAVSAAWRYTQDIEAIAKAVREFKGLEHRLQIIAQKQDITFVDDSIATTPSAAIAAIQAFDKPKIVILGGSDKGADFKDLAQAVANGNVRQALLIGKTAGSIAEALKVTGFNQYEVLSGGMKEVVKRAAELSDAGDVILLSPACASFDQYKSYQDRAEQFAAAVKEL